MENWLHLQPLKKTPLNLGATGGVYAVLFGAIPSPRGARAGEGQILSKNQKQQYVLSRQRHPGCLSLFWLAVLTP